MHYVIFKPFFGYVSARNWIFEHFWIIEAYFWTLWWMANVPVATLSEAQRLVVLDHTQPLPQPFLKYPAKVGKET